MTHPAKEIAKALATAISGLTLSRSFTVARVWVPKRIAREDLPTVPMIWVAPTGDASERAARQVTQRTVVVDLAVLCAVPSADPADVDPLSDFVEELMLALPAELDIPDNSQNAWYDTDEVATLADPESLSNGTFFYVTRITWGLYQ